MAGTTIFTAREIVTMNRYLPTAEAVAVRDGRILCVGTLDECLSWDAEAEVDTRFADLVLVPGFVEAHGHTAQGATAASPYVGYFDSPLPDGGVARGVRTYDEFKTRLRELDATLPEGQLLLAMGFDPIYFADQPRLDKSFLDDVSTTRPIAIRHASGHLLTVNSKVLEMEGITAASTTEGVDRDEQGEPTGELQEAPAMALATQVMTEMQRIGTSLDGVLAYARLCRDAGVTTSTELAGMMLVAPQVGPAWQSVVDADGFPIRLVMYNIPALPGTAYDAAALAQATVDARETESDRFRIGGIKALIDGSLQGWTAAMLWPGYYRGEDQGLLTEDPDRLTELLVECNRRMVNVHAHANGNGAGQMLIESVEKAVLAAPWLDHRHTLTHSQTTTSAQYRKMARLGMCANIFSNHIWYWGDQHLEQTQGPELTKRMWAHRTAIREGVPIGIHSDAGVTPVGMLNPMWCAVNRETVSGRVLGEEEKITAYEALEAATLGGAFQIHMDDEIGSIETGKRADFAVLSDSPLSVDPHAIRDIEVWGTVLGGVPSAKGS